MSTKNIYTYNVQCLQTNAVTNTHCTQGESSLAIKRTSELDIRCVEC